MNKVFKYLPVLLLLYAFMMQMSHNSLSASGFYSHDSVLSDSTTSLVDSVKIKNELLSEGKQLYEKKCQKCHTLYLPKDYRLKQWKENLNEMKEKAELTSNEYKLILGYLSENCKK